MTPKQIQDIRRKMLGEDTATFAVRFACSARTIEDWEQGRHKPSPLVLRMLEKLKKRVG